MTEIFEGIARAAAIGIGATVVMDVWLLLLRQLRIPTLDFGLLGRWLGHLVRGKRAHDSIAKAAPLEHEVLLGWCGHYAIGVAFAALLLLAVGLDWARAPTLAPALSIGIATIVAPLFIMQPAMGAGVAGSKTPTPFRNCIRSLANHTAFGLGLYLAAVATATLIPTAR